MSGSGQADAVLVARVKNYARDLRVTVEAGLSVPSSAVLNIIDLLEDVAHNIEKRRSFIDETVKAFQAQEVAQ